MGGAGDGLAGGAVGQACHCALGGAGEGMDRLAELVVVELFKWLAWLASGFVVDREDELAIQVRAASAGRSSRRASCTGRRASWSSSRRIFSSRVLYGAK